MAEESSSEKIMHANAELLKIAFLKEDVVDLDPILKLIPFLINNFVKRYKLEKHRLSIETRLMNEAIKNNIKDIIKFIPKAARILSSKYDIDKKEIITLFKEIMGEDNNKCKEILKTENICEKPLYKNKGMCYRHYSYQQRARFGEEVEKAIQQSQIQLEEIQNIIAPELPQLGEVGEVGELGEPGTPTKSSKTLEAYEQKSILEQTNNLLNTLEKIRIITSPETPTPRRKLEMKIIGKKPE